MESYIFSGVIGKVHTVAAIFALLFGTLILLKEKGTKVHKAVGYLYVLSMIILISTAFMIFELFNGIGIFHIFALLSLIALIGGMYPVIFRKRVKNWYAQHLEVMSWSVVGLYAAFVAEVSVRLFPQEYFFLIVGLGGGVVTTIGAYLIKKRKKKALTIKET